MEWISYRHCVHTLYSVIMKEFVSVQNLRWTKTPLVSDYLKHIQLANHVHVLNRYVCHWLQSLTLQRHGKFSLWSHWYIECFTEATVCLPARTVWSAVSLEIAVQKFFSTFCPLTSLAPHHCTMMPSLPQAYSKKEVRASSGPLFSLALISWITCPQCFSPALLWFSTSISFC